MAVSLDGLQPEFRQNVLNLIANLAAKGIEMRPCAALRKPDEQAILWRQSRAKEEIEAAIAKLRSQGGDFLADTLQNVGPQHGEHVTNALPGFSWHQWGEAVDCFWVVNGTAEWSTTRTVDGVNGYKRECCKLQPDRRRHMVEPQGLAACSGKEGRIACGGRPDDQGHRSGNEKALRLGRSYG